MLVVGCNFYEMQKYIPQYSMRRVVCKITFSVDGSAPKRTEVTNLNSEKGPNHMCADSTTVIKTKNWADLITGVKNHVCFHFFQGSNPIFYSSKHLFAQSGIWKSVWNNDCCKHSVAAFTNFDYGRTPTWLSILPWGGCQAERSNTRDRRQSCMIHEHQVLSQVELYLLSSRYRKSRWLQ